MIRTLLTAVLPLASLGLTAVEGLTPDTIFNDIPGDATVREIVTTGGGGGGVAHGEMTAYVDACAWDPLDAVGGLTDDQKELLKQALEQESSAPKPADSAE